MQPTKDLALASREFLELFKAKANTIFYRDLLRSYSTHEVAIIVGLVMMVSTPHEQFALLDILREVNKPIPLTPEERAVIQFQAKPAPGLNACGCVGPQAIPGEATWNLDRKSEVRLNPACPCAMQWYENVDGNYYKIISTDTWQGTKLSAVLVGPVGGPYTGYKA